MNAVNIEIKARCPNIGFVRDLLKTKNARYIGLDHQVDTYFTIPEGRLKLRQGTIENALIFYKRENKKGPKHSDIKLCRLNAGDELKDILCSSLGTSAIVDKHREIYFIDNVKFHLDQVKQLGNFVEIEAIDENGSISIERLRQQCDDYMQLFKIESSHLISQSYGDLVKTHTHQPQ